MSVYSDFLKKEIFKVSEYHQFNLLFDSLSNFKYAENEHVAILERSYIYNGKSIFAGLVDAKDITIVDYKTEQSSDRSGYQSSWVDNSNFEYPLASAFVKDTGQNHEIGFKSLNCETLLIPNVLHHCRDFPHLAEKLTAAMPDLQRIYIFDSYLRENHQNPDDFCRYTPSALSNAMEKLGFKTEKLEEIGNIFDAILYFISQANVVLEAPELSDLKTLVKGDLVPRLREIREDEKYRPLGRPFATASTAYAMTFQKA